MIGVKDERGEVDVILLVTYKKEVTMTKEQIDELIESINRGAEIVTRTRETARQFLIDLDLQDLADRIEAYEKTGKYS